MARADRRSLRPHRGEAVIVIGLDDRPIVAIVSSLEDAPKAGFRWSHLGSSGTCLFADKGITWMSWGPPGDSEAVRALEAAYKLARSAA